MKIAHLDERIKDYKKSIDAVVQKKIHWKSHTRAILLKTLNNIMNKYDIGWRVQELNWIHSNEAVNITFDSFPPELIEKTNQIPSYQFIKGRALVFYQGYDGDVHVIILFPFIDNLIIEDSSMDLGIYNPNEINEKFIIEKVDEFLKEMIKWEVPNIQNKLGFKIDS